MACGKSKILKKVRCFFSHANQLIFAFNTSLDIKKRLDAIASDHSKFGLSVDHQSIWKRREETCSYVYEERITGRDSDKEEVVGMLLNTNVEQDVSFMTILGIGGLGKTTLAQLLYNDDRIKCAFQLRLWVSVSQEFGMKEILRKMLMSLPDEKFDGLVLDQLQRRVREHIETHRYLLVLDDVWNESRDAWVKLKDFLVGGRKGSKVVVTSRSKEVARAVGNYPMYELQGLSTEDSWKLFKQMAFDREEHVDANLAEIGKDVIKKCANVPLSVRVIGSLLYGQGEDKWLLFQKNDLAKIQEAKDSTMAILKFSYCHLSLILESCFSYCALFPNDYSIEKDVLIGLWMANGCILPQYEGQSIEDVGEEYFSILLQRCFFQDIKEHKYDGTITFKVHDLMHDLALEAAGHELMVLSSMGSYSNGNIRHLSITEGRPVLKSPYDIPSIRMLRTFVKISGELCHSNATKILSHCRCLRWLDLRGA